MDDKIEFVIEPSRGKFFDWKELWQYRELFYFFSWRDLKVKYKQTVLGVAWVVLQPLFTVLIFSLFFGRALNVPSLGLPYPVFVFSGLLLWTLFSTSVNNAGNSMMTNAPIIKKIYFPRIIIPVSSILVCCVDFVVTCLVFAGVLLIYQVKPDLWMAVLYWPLSIILMLCGTLGISCWLAALNVKYRDFRYVVPFALQIALFVSPVIYPVSILGTGWVSYLLALNPMYSAIMLFRIPLTGIPTETYPILISVLSTFFFLLLGVYYFKRTEAYFADIA